MVVSVFLTAELRRQHLIKDNKDCGIPISKLKCKAFVTLLQTFFPIH